MSTHKHFDKICCVVIGFTLILTVFFMNVEAFGVSEEATVMGYENKLFEIWPLIKSYPSSSTLVAKILMSEDVFNSLFTSIN